MKHGMELFRPITTDLSWRPVKKRRGVSPNGLKNRHSDSPWAPQNPHPSTRRPRGEERGISSPDNNWPARTHREKKVGGIDFRTKKTPIDRTEADGSEKKFSALCTATVHG